MWSFVLCMCRACLLAWCSMYADIGGSHFNYLPTEPKSRQTGDPLQRAEINNAGRTCTSWYKNIGTNAVLTRMHKRNIEVNTQTHAFPANKNKCVKEYVVRGMTKIKQYFLVICFWLICIDLLLYAYRRLYPVVIGNGRNLQSDAVISGYHVPKGVSIIHLWVFFACLEGQERMSGRYPPTPSNTW